MCPDGIVVKTFDVKAEPEDVLEVVNPVVRVTAWFQFVDVRAPRHGSGFIIGAWRRRVITARHNVRLDVPHQLDSVAVSLEAGPQRVVVPALSVAYPVDPAMDVAVIHLSRGIANPSVVYDTSEASDTPFACSLSGFPEGAGLTMCQLTARFVGPWIEYSRGNGLRGMSGGPVARGDNVVGIHVGRLDLGSRVAHCAVPFDGDLLSRCMNAT